MSIGLSFNLKVATKSGIQYQQPSPKSFEEFLLQLWIISFHFQASNYALDACISGCDIFSRIEYDRGTHEPLENLKNCNYSKFIMNIWVILVNWRG